jgi:hypothetical protein
MDKKEWVNPELNVFGDVKELTQQVIPKTGVSGDVIHIGNQDIPVPGSSLS